ncbi:MAG: YicC family protein [Candidatus Omnitrophota bacterium]|jgi:uncharacterized protein (TIGR00255 family)|nr:MAG: YicC family protein [Candidatus Omnitrophota bacterium]
MITSMTGFGAAEADIGLLGKVRIELRSSNHKFLEVSLHLSEGFLSLEDKFKKEIESKIKRGRVVCVMNMPAHKSSPVSINKALLKNYLDAISEIKSQFNINDELSINTVIQLPGLFSSVPFEVPGQQVWPGIQVLLHKAINKMLKARQKEGRALNIFLKKRLNFIDNQVKVIRVRFIKVMKDKTRLAKNTDEQSSILKESDISEEIERLSFHVKNFKDRIAKNGPMGKELDFIAQEMQREANTLGAKSCSVLISAKVVQVKSQIEKIREQLQNVE